MFGGSRASADTFSSPFQYHDFCEDKKILLKRVMDRVFDREDPAEAFGDLFSSAHTENIVTRIGSRNEYDKAGKFEQRA